MVELAFLIGIFSYLIFGLGVLGGLKGLGFLGVGLAAAVVVLVIRKKVWEWAEKLWQDIKKDKLCLFLSFLFLVQAGINLIGALGPELGFDALWYHLTLPKIYLQAKTIFFIPGGLFYYSAMPKLTEMLYLLALSINSAGILAKLIHFSFGILSAVALYNLARKYLNPRFSLLSVLIFYSTLIVGWQSTTAYVDLARTFFEILALDLFLQWWKKTEKLSFLLESAIMLGLAVSTKLIALATLPVFLILILIRSRKLLVIGYWLLVIGFIVSPWLLFSFIHTGNPFYPLFSAMLDVSHRFVFPSVWGFAKDVWILFYHPQDLISPVFLIFLPVVLWRFIKARGVRDLAVLRVLGGYCILTLIFWCLTPQTGGGRFFLPYLPAWSLFLAGAVSMQNDFLKKMLVVLSVFVGITNIGYRAAANARYLPVIFGKQSQENFLEQNLNFKFNDFYDINGEIGKGKIIKKDDWVLIHGSHNLFYADFPFIHTSYAFPSRYYSYLLTQNADPPKGLNNLKLLYQNTRSGVRLYLLADKFP